MLQGVEGRRVPGPRKPQAKHKCRARDYVAVRLKKVLLKLEVLGTNKIHKIVFYSCCIVRLILQFDYISFNYLQMKGQLQIKKRTCPL